MSRNLFVLNDAPYGSERTYNGLRLAMSMARRQDQSVRVFLIGDAASAAKHGQKTPKGYYNVETMLRSIAASGGEIGVCGSCMDARGLDGDPLGDGCRRSNMDELTEWSLWAEHILVF